MIFIYATDLHGNIKKYNDILNYAIRNNIKTIHLGADLLPKNDDLINEQKVFINSFLKKFYKKAKENNIELLAFFGNDDIYLGKKDFRKFGFLLDEQTIKINEYLFKAYPFVCDYPFNLKTACKLDYKGWQKPLQYYSKAIDISDKSFQYIDDLDDYFSKKSTIEEDLKKIKGPYENLIMSFHMPPNKLGLDVCGDVKYMRNLRYVGSLSIYNWIYEKEPLLCLCGHIHESSTITGVWKVMLNKTLIIQPGQMKKTTFVVIDIKNKEIKTELIEIT